MAGKTSAVIPAYNEEKNLARVIDLCLKTREIDELIVVNDGSTDQTLEAIAKFKNRIKIVDLPENLGKSQAVAVGIRKAKYENLLLLDADLINFSPYHLKSLITPVLNNEVDMTIGDLKANFDKPFSKIWPFSGQRCFKKKAVLPILKELEKSSSYSLEVILNEHFRGKRVVVIPIISEKELYLKKPQKEKDWLTNYLKEDLQILKNIVSAKSKRLQRRLKEKF